MRKIEQTGQFRRDYKREAKGLHRKVLAEELKTALSLLANDRPMPERYFDHPLVGNWNDHRDCHIRPDLVLIYRKPDEGRLQLVRLGSHSELGI
ncbi:type II toxin-antitoxin system YafQ family toxin [Ferrovum myxofaciens]|jgi:mRNA interferase YafQ|uniref:mRNA interferase YafQ n=1 Tax=Ferrovum myxofaciens TaxID=416213 RepID=A0A149VV52_9PROT|nr:type II toxin-antitoxin system YafQ family toxin [Ferrovum myxofaciens]KXW57066.1 mRNA interferase YafQ [Ferrovum myxofaciens]MBU6994223.1 type II toxin-antitoxin system YafQ family toxin [Ferrovum myxofaciens]MBU6995958.1 type II toxin-antitoxin system YafQ family toxin [Ferrovum myxofaciens]